MRNLLLLVFLFLSGKIVSQNVGIGITNPTEAKLVINHNAPNLLAIRNTTAGAAGNMTEFLFQSGTQYTGAIKSINTQSNYARLGFFTYATGNSTNLKERLSITDSGFVGINQTDPQTLLVIKGNSDYTVDKRRVLIENAKLQISAPLNENALEVVGDAVFDQSYIQLNSSRLGIGISPSYDLDIANSSIRIADGNQGTGKVLTSNNLGVATWQDPANAKSLTATFTADQVIPPNTATAIKFLTNVGDGFSDFGITNFNNSTNTFTAPADGNYLVEAQVRFSVAGGSLSPNYYQFRLEIVRSSPSFARLASSYNSKTTPSSASYLLDPFITISKVVKLTAGDVIKINAEHDIPIGTFTVSVINPLGYYSYLNIVKL
ncbi:hypothetical protein ACQ33O_03095 [Ferruginibacter sp. SUN002]|uniref:hypothetical protein n=1 Tax=Ferruginibacter sp. SUN002 TaxID=2937789 RepID=UPI003D368204